MNNFYENHHREYFNNTFKIDPEIFLSPLIRLLNPGDSILDIGCGPGRDLLWCSQRGFHAVGFEQSPNLARLAREHSGCSVIEGDFYQYDFSSLCFSALVFVGSLVHLSRKHLTAILELTCQALVPDGLILITMKEGEGISTAADGRIFTLMSTKELKVVFAGHHLQILDFSRQISRICQDDIWLGYVVKRK